MENESLLTRKANQISNKLSDGSYDSFVSATKDLKQAYIYEKRTDDEKGQKIWEKGICECAMALNIYEECVSDSEILAIKKMREVGLDMFADALESGDYSTFAY